MNRLTSSFWVQAYIKKLNLLGVPAFVVSHGDDTAGAIIVKVNKLNGDAVLFERSFSLDKMFVSHRISSTDRKNVCQQ